MKKITALFLVLLIMLSLGSCGIGNSQIFGKLDIFTEDLISNGKSTISGYYDIASASSRGLSVDLVGSYFLVENQDGDLYSYMRIVQGDEIHTYFLGNLQEMPSEDSSVQYKFWINEMTGNGFEESDYYMINYNPSEDTVSFTCDSLDCTFVYAEVQKTKVELVEELIASIGVVSLDSEDAIQEAELCVSALTSSEKDSLVNLDILLTARTDLDNLQTLKRSVEILAQSGWWNVRNITGISRLVFDDDSHGHAHYNSSALGDDREFSYSFVDSNTIEITFDDTGKEIQFIVGAKRLTQSDNGDGYATFECLSDLLGN